jgi:protein-S-isoprenylcysteine O-methyltransferase Ste14
MSASSLFAERSVVRFGLPPAYYAAHMAAMPLLHFALPLAQWNFGMMRWWGFPFAVFGIVLVVAAVRRFGSRTTLHPFERPSFLITEGPYRFGRNPMYTGLAASLVGAGIMLGTLSPLLAIPLFVVLMRVRFIAYEERALEACFGDEYRVYRRRVRRWL